MTYFLSALVFSLHLCLCEGVRTSGAGVIDSAQLPNGCWELNVGLLQEQQVLLAVELPRQPTHIISETGSC